MRQSERRVLECLAGGCFIVYADGGPRVRGGGYRQPSHWLISPVATMYGRRYEATRISATTFGALTSKSWIYDYGDYGISPAGQAAIKPPRPKAGR